MDKYRYPVFFEVRSRPIDSELKTIQSYFKIRRRSGGGDCGSVRKDIENFYKISFSDQEDQQRVLKKSEHVLELPGGPLVLTVRGTLDSTSPSSAAATPGLASQQSIPVPALPPSGVDHELQFDTCLLTYLEEECPRAWRELEQELSSLGCSIKLHPDDGRVLIRGSAQAGLNLDQWKAQVEDQWVCHYEVEPLKRQVLLQSAAVQDHGEGVRVYSKAGEGLAVVVGGRSEVQARLRELEGSEFKGRGSGVKLADVKSTLRFGVAKLGLLWGELEREFGDAFPGTKVTHGDPGHLVLEGSSLEVLQAREWLSSKELSVQEKVVAEVSPCLLSFLRQRYGGPGELEAVLGLGCQVKIELGDTDVRVLALASDQLSEAERALRAEFREEMVDVPECSTIPAELRARLLSKSVQMNQGGGRVVIRISSGSRVHILGHVQEVLDIQQNIGDFLLEQAIVARTVGLPSIQIAECLPQLVEYLALDQSGVTFDTSASSASPAVVLSGALSRVTQVQDRLGSALDSLVWERLVIDRPGALRYLQSPAGREALRSVGRSQRCLVRLAPDGGAAGAGPPHPGLPQEASYRLPNGLRVLVRQGDLTEERADGLVNAANESLDHGGGVAATLSEAGGPEVQRESRTLVRQMGKVPTGGVVVTTGGRLRCSLLIHAVGPVRGQAGGRESALVEQTARAALDMAESMDFRSLAMPCISSGIFGVPIKVCAEAIATAVREFGGQPRSVTRVTLIDMRRDVVRAMMEACDRLFPPGARDTSGPRTEPHTSREEPRPGGFPSPGPGRGGSAGASAAADVCIQVEIILGSIETQQVDALVSPMAGHHPLSSRVGNILYELVGPQLTSAFHVVSGGATGPGDEVLVEGLPGLWGGRVFFLHCVAWDHHPQGQAVRVMRQAIQRVLASCEKNGFGSVAFPVLGTGVVLGFPHDLAAMVLLGEIHFYERRRAARSPFLVRIVIHPNDTESTKAFQSAQGSLHLKGFTSDAHPEQTSFYRYVSSTQDDVTALLGGVTLQLVCGDIINETTDVIVNPTDFSSNLSALSMAIQTAAGPTIQAELAKMGVPPDMMCTTGPGLLGCKEIVHASFKCDPQRIRKSCGKILKQCESRGHRSVAFPAVNTGVGGMAFSAACKAMLDGVASTVRDLNPRTLSVIRIVILQRPVFQAFKSELENRLGGMAPPLSLKERAKQVLKKTFNLTPSPTHGPRSSSSAPQSLHIAPCRPPPVLLLVAGTQRDALGGVQQELESLLAQQSDEREVDGMNRFLLEVQEVRAIQEKAQALGVSVELGGPEWAAGADSAGAGARDGGGGGGGVSYVLHGLTEDVLNVGMELEQAVNRALGRGLLEREEALLAIDVQWSMERGHGGHWTELGLGANYLLEKAHLGGEVSAPVEGPDGVKLMVNLKTNEATDWLTGRTYKVKREESAALPEYWDPMSVEDKLKIPLSPSSIEHQRVAQDFRRTAPNFTILNIERVQNLFLWQAYAVLKQRYHTKNGGAEVGERMLYHGTAATSCSSIEMSGFNRGFTTSAAHGVGVYFAVNASYSTNDRFSPRDPSGHKRMYVARVLTGRFTRGDSSMRVPPARSTSDPHNRYDSLVDNTQQPTMFVVFHDDQAYPEYIITFR